MFQSMGLNFIAVSLFAGGFHKKGKGVGDSYDLYESRQAFQVPLL